MDTMERDPAYIADQLKFMRKMFRWTQENLANAAGLTTRTIEKVESGRHRPDEQTLRSIARAFNIDGIEIFEKPTPEAQARQRAEIERASRKMVMVPSRVIRTAADFLAAFGPIEYFRTDTSLVEEDQVLDLVASMADQIRDFMDMWTEVYETDRLSYARSFAEQCNKLEKLGFHCHMGQHRQRLRDKGRHNLVFAAGFMSIRPKTDGGLKYAMVQLDGRWETLEEDRPKMLREAEALSELGRHR